MTTFKIAALCLTLLALHAQQVMSVRSGSARVILSNYVDGHLDGGQSDKEKHFFAKGDLVQLHSPEKGFTARGRELEFTWAELDPKTMEFRKGRIEGSSTIIFDSNVAQKALTEDAIKLKTKPPVPPAESNFMQLDSDRFTYSGDVDRGKIVMPDPWTFKHFAKGTLIKQVEVKVKGAPAQPKNTVPVKVDYDQTFDATGSKGEITVVQGPDGNLGKVETGSLEGPVHFKVVRHETPQDTGVSSTTTYVGVADRIDIAMAMNPGTITASGHVTVDADSEEFHAHFDEDKFVFVVSDKMEPQSIQFSGTPGKTPGKTTAKVKDGTR